MPKNTETLIATIVSQKLRIEEEMQRVIDQYKKDRAANVRYGKNSKLGTPFPRMKPAKSVTAGAKVYWQLYTPNPRADEPGARTFNTHYQKVGKSIPYTRAQFIRWTVDDDRGIVLETEARLRELEGESLAAAQAIKAIRGVDAKYQKIIQKVQGDD